MLECNDINAEVIPCNLKLLINEFSQYVNALHGKGSLLS